MIFWSTIILSVVAVIISYHSYRKTKRVYEQIVAREREDAQRAYEEIERKVRRR